MTKIIKSHHVSTNGGFCEADCEYVKEIYESGRYGRCKLFDEHLKFNDQLRFLERCKKCIEMGIEE